MKLSITAEPRVEGRLQEISPAALYEREEPLEPEAVTVLDEGEPHLLPEGVRQLTGADGEPFRERPAIQRRIAVQLTDDGDDERIVSIFPNVRKPSKERAPGQGAGAVSQGLDDVAYEPAENGGLKLTAFVHLCRGQGSIVHHDADGSIGAKDGCDGIPAASDDARLTLVLDGEWRVLEHQPTGDACQRSGRCFAVMESCREIDVVFVCRFAS